MTAPMKKPQPLEMPTIEEKRLVQAEVNLELFRAVDQEIKRQHLTFRAVTEWGLKAWLLATNPAAAKRLGIVPPG